MSKGSKVLLAGLAGIAAGVVIGMLFAPDRGSKTRKRLKKEFCELAESEGKDFSEKLKSFSSIFSSEEADDEEPAKEQETQS